MSQIRAGSDPSTTKEGAAASTSSSSSSASSADGQALQNAEGENTAAVAAAATTAPSSSRSRAKRKAPATDGDADGTKKRTYARTDYRKDPVHRARLDDAIAHVTGLLEADPRAFHRIVCQVSPTAFEVKKCKHPAHTPSLYPADGQGAGYAVQHPPRQLLAGQR